MRGGCSNEKKKTDAFFLRVPREDLANKPTLTLERALNVSVETRSVWTC